MIDISRLDDFAPEPAGAAAASLVSLAAVISREVPVHWDEAVAIVEELCERLVSPDGSELHVPGLQETLISSEGAVTFRVSGRGEKGPVEAARALHALLSTADVPVALRLFVTQATVPETHDSIRQFAAALAYFGKPGRRELVRALYDRYVSAQGEVKASVPIQPLPRAREAKVPDIPVPPPQRRKLNRVVPLGLAGCCLVSAAIWWWPSSAVSGTDEGASAGLLSQTREVIAGLSVGVRETLGVGAEPPALEQKAAEVTARPPRSARTIRPAAASPVTIEIPELPPPSATPESALTAPPASPPLLEALQLPVHVPADREAVRDLYSSDDSDVSPPVLLYPQLPPPLIIDSRDGPVNRMEVVVSAEGIVEHVRLVNGPTRMPDMMLLSGAKLWKFTPAFKDGEPVRYRTVLSWSGFP